MKTTLLTRLKPEFKLQLKAMEINNQLIIENILSEEQFITELKLRNCVTLMVFFNLSSLDKVVYLFD